MERQGRRFHRPRGEAPARRLSRTPPQCRPATDGHALCTDRHAFWGASAFAKSGQADVAMSRCFKKRSASEASNLPEWECLRDRLRAAVSSSTQPAAERECRLHTMWRRGGAARRSSRNRRDRRAIDRQRLPHRAAGRDPLAQQQGLLAQSSRRSSPRSPKTVRNKPSARARGTSGAALDRAVRA
jgi:hypothetical protein